MTSTVKITSWRPARRGSILGYARAQYSSGVIICEISVIQGPRGPWAAPPSKARIGSDGSVKRDENGKVQHLQLIGFSTPALKRRWSAEIIAAMREAYPNFDSEAEEVFEE